MMGIHRKDSSGENFIENSERSIVVDDINVGLIGSHPVKIKQVEHTI